MDGTSEFYCMASSDSSEGTEVTGEPRQWTTFTWSDEFGNTIAPFFTSREAGKSFLSALKGWQLKRYPASFVVTVILADIKNDTSFYTIDPVSVREFKALSANEFLTELIYQRRPAGNETRTVIPEHEEVVPLDAVLGEGGDRYAEGEYRHLLSAADVIFGIDVTSGKQSIVFGRSSLEELVRTGQSNVLGIVNVGLGQDAGGIDKLAALVNDIKGKHDYFSAKIT